MSQLQPAQSAESPSLRADLVSGLLVSLIALPLCLGIAMASGFPPAAGILTAIIGGVISTWLGSAPLTIKGPAAGLIVIAIGAVQELGGGDLALGYKRALATIVVAAALQIGFALFRAGKLGDFFPGPVVHGMLASIGVIIFAKQAHVLMGVTPTAKEPLHLLAEIPHSFANMNPEVAVIGFVSLAILFGHSALAGRVRWIRKIPAPMLVLLAAVPLGFAFDLEHEHTYALALNHHNYALGPKFLVNLPANIAKVITFPDFSQILSGVSFKYVAMFALVGSIESLLSARAVDILDPQKRTSDLNKDLLAVGVGNLLAGMLGGLPMISEIVRSSANISYGAKSRLSNFFHGLSLLICVLFLGGMIHRIPLAALAGMLVFTGIRLANPKELVHVLEIGREELAVFVFTLMMCLFSDLLVGVASGILLAVALHLMHGTPVRSLFRPDIKEAREGASWVMQVGNAAVFSNFLSIKSRVGKLTAEQHITLDFTDARFVDHTVMERLHEMGGEFTRAGRQLEVRGLEGHRSLSQHPLAARKKSPPPV